MTMRPTDDAPREGERLGRLLFGITSLDEAISRLGEPDRDTSLQHPPVTGNVPRIIVWKNLSTVFTVVAYLERDGRFSIRGEDKTQWES